MTGQREGTTVGSSDDGEKIKRFVRLDVWHRNLVVRVGYESYRLICPGFAYGFVGREAA